MLEKKKNDSSKHACTICGKIFTQTSTFERHKRAHAREEEHTARNEFTFYDNDALAGSNDDDYESRLQELRDQKLSLGPGSTEEQGRMLMKSSLGSGPDNSELSAPNLFRHEGGATFSPQHEELESALKDGSSSTGLRRDRHSAHAPAPSSAVQQVDPEGMEDSALEVYVCTFPGCNAQPFQTQRLLDYHASAHSSARTYYCPVAGCLRSNGGKGFMQEDDMITHRLVHISRESSVTCPFCPDKRRKYYRPDNFPRHVRKYHPYQRKDGSFLRSMPSKQSSGAQSTKQIENTRNDVDAAVGLKRGNPPGSSLKSSTSREVERQSTFTSPSTVADVAAYTNLLNKRREILVPKPSDPTPSFPASSPPPVLPIEDDVLDPRAIWTEPSSTSTDSYLTAPRFLDDQFLFTRRPPLNDFLSPSISHVIHSPTDEEQPVPIFKPLPFQVLGLDDLNRAFYVPNDDGNDAATPPADSAYGTASIFKSDATGLNQRVNEAGEHSKLSETEELSDTATQYSDASSTTLNNTQSYIQDLARNLFDQIGVLKTDDDTKSRISAVLPRLLKAFALKLGVDAQTQMHRDVMSFVHKHRCDISTKFTEIEFKDGEDDTEGDTTDLDGMTWRDRMTFWLHKEETEQGQNSQNIVEYPQQGPHLVTDAKSAEADEDFDTAFILGEDDEDHLDLESSSESPPETYSKFVVRTEAYQWLLSRLKREFKFVSPEPSSMQMIADEIMEALPTLPRISRRHSSQTFTAIMEFDWDIFKFFDSQGYSQSPDEVLERVVTLTGSGTDAQADSCGRYVRQIWSFTGENILELLKSTLRGQKGPNCILFDGTNIRVLDARPKLIVKISGVAASVAEVGEQLAWFGAALRPSSQQVGVVACTPAVTDMLKKGPKSRADAADITCVIGFEMEIIPRPSKTSNGRCWHNIFKNPVVAKGYPIPRRPKWGTGLEVPITILAALAQTERVDSFKDTQYLKGFSTLLVPTERNEGVVYWHLIYEESGRRISYLEGDSVTQGRCSGRFNLGSHRHILGWCYEAEFYAGSREAQYPQKAKPLSRFPRPAKGSALADTKVEQGRIIQSRRDFEISPKDVSVSHPGGYIGMLKCLATEYVLIWDDEYKRGWLLNGQSALLHLLQASLSYDNNSNLGECHLCDVQDLRYPHNTLSIDTAAMVLSDNYNLSLPLHKEKDGHILLMNRIDRICNLLEKLIDHQFDIAGDQGEKLSAMPRGMLEGWSFEELAKAEKRMHSCVATLDAPGKGWVDFTRTIQAVTLIGRGFGHLIRPVDNGLCSYWSQLPRDSYYIACGLSDLAGMMDRCGGCIDDHTRVSEKLILHTPTTMFVTCSCQGSLENDHCEPVQTLFPSDLSTELLSRRESVEEAIIEGKGAVIFGHNSKFSWTWEDSGPPKAATSESMQSDSEEIVDSGIALSSRSSKSDFLSPPSSSSTSTRSKRRRKQSESSKSFAREWNLPTTPSEVYCRSQYTVGIICPLPKELKAVRALFDRKHHCGILRKGDNNQYVLGEMAGHMVVAAGLPEGQYGTTSASEVASAMAYSFESIRFYLLVGIAGGVPSKKNDIRLGDVVVGREKAGKPAVIQYDFGKEEDDRFAQTGVFARPTPVALATALTAMLSDVDLRENPLGPYIQCIAERAPEYKYPGCDVAGGPGLGGGEEGAANSQHARRDPTQPSIHYGLVASGNRVVKSESYRDKLWQEHGMLCFEMEAAGIVVRRNCLVIRGISDYCDSQKNDDWQNYAAATAAAYAKLLLRYVGKVTSGLGDDEPVSKRRRPL